MRTALVACCACLLAGAAAAAEVLVVDPGASRLRIHLTRAGILGFAGHEHEIEAPLGEGRVEIAETGAAGSTVRLRFESARLAIVPGSEPDKDVPAVEARMRGPEVLDVERYPAITFESTEVVEDKGAAAAGAVGPVSLRLRGTLGLHGRKVPVEIPVRVRRDGAGLVASGETSLQLRALGIEPPSVGGVVKVANTFRLAFEIHAR
ncbi:MAG TPA: YceI family protein [Vicinamibacteria bacterium]|nr:YceI family protein [Vicinamibacteria bacterium]